MSAHPSRRMGRSCTRPAAQLNPPQLTWFDRAGKPLGTLGEGGVDVNLSLSPDERQVAVALRSGSPENLDIWTIDIARNLGANRVTTDAQPEGWPVWSPRWHTHRVRKRPARHRGTAGEGAVGSDSGQRDRAEGNAPRSRGNTFTAMWPATMRSRRRPTGPQTDVSCCTRSAGRFRRHRTSGPFRSLGTANRFQLHRLSSPRVWERSPRTVDGSPTRPTRPASPTSTFSHFFAPAGKHRISPNGGRNPHWRADGRELFYLDAAGTMTAVPIDADRELPGRVAKDAFSGWGGQRQQRVRGDQGWPAVPRQQTAECGHRSAADRHRQLDLDAPEIIPFVRGRRRSGPRVHASLPVPSREPPGRPTSLSISFGSARRSIATRCRPPPATSKVCSFKT